jgi:DNA-binding MarR family transcriptional regulator
METMESDHVDRILQQWARERPDLDVSPIGVIGRISRASRRLERVLARNFARFGLTNASYDVLASLRRAGPPYRLSPTQLYHSLMISSGTMTNRIDQLERAGLVTRLPDPTDRRGVMVELTPQGRELVDAVVEAHAATELGLVSVLTDEEKECLSATLRKLLLTLERDEGETGRDGAEETA